MSRRTAPAITSNRAALRRRVLSMIRDFNAKRWARCYERIDPRLREKGSPQPAAHAEQLLQFHAVYGPIQPWHVRVSLHLDATGNKHDPRPFAYVYIVWQDAAKGFHMFRERWVKEGEDWFSRVVGLVPATATSVRGD